MSGHSKWHNIQARKGKVDAQRGALFTKLSRAITIAARSGADPSFNFSLALAIDRAKEGNLPKDKIEKAVASGAGAAKDGVQIEEIMYEGFGPGKVAVMVSCATENKNRTFAEVRRIFTEFGGALAGPGAVSWQFVEMGVLRIDAEEAKKITDEVELELIDLGAEDFIKHEDGTLEVRTQKTKFGVVFKKLNELKVSQVRGALEWVAKETVKVEDEHTHASLEKFFGALDENDDVQEFYTNAV